MKIHPSTTLGAAIRKYGAENTTKKKSANVEKYRVRRWLNHALAERPLNRLKGTDFGDYRDQRLEEGAAPGTVRKELIFISALFTAAVKDWGLEELPNPITKMRVPQDAPGRKRRLLKHEEPKLLAAAKDRLRVMILFALDTAMRRGEIAKLRWENVDFERKEALVQNTKNGDSRTVPLSKRARKMLRELQPMGVHTGTVFGVSPRWITEHFRRTAKRAELDNIRFHDMRHEATSRLFESGKFTLIEIARITGHKDLTALDGYTHLGAGFLADRMDDEED